MPCTSVHAYGVSPVLALPHINTACRHRHLLVFATTYTDPESRLHKHTCVRALQVFEDRSGAVVVSFDRRRALAEGDLPTYMQNLVKSHWLVAEYSLVKDGTQWGLVDDETQSVFYLMWPPWVRHRFVGPLPSGVGQGGQGVEGSQGSASSEPSSPSRGAKSAGSGVMSEASLQRQAVLSSDFAKMGALSRSAAQVKPPTTAGVSAGAAGQGAGVARSVGLPSRSNTGVAVA